MTGVIPIAVGLLFYCSSTVLVNRNNFTRKDNKVDGSIYEPLYLEGSFKGEKDYG